MFAKDVYELGSRKSCIRELFAYGLQKAAEVGRENVFDFSLGNPSIPAPEKVNETIGDIIASRDSLEVHGYTVAAGSADVRKAVADNLNGRFGTELKPENIFMTCGAAPALTAVLRALKTDRGEIVAFAPCFPEYRVFVEGAGMKFVLVPADTDSFEISAEQLLPLLNENTQAVIINSPNNPSGVVYSAEVIGRIAALLREKKKEYGHPIYIIADEPYRELVYDGVEVPFIPNLYDDAIVCYSWSKSLSLPGERIGYVCVPDKAEDSRELMTAVAGAARLAGHVCAPSLQQAVVAECIAEMPDVSAYDRNRKTLYEALVSFGYRCPKPEGAFYIFASAPGMTGKEFSDRAKELNVLVVPGDDFGCRDFFRICTCVSYDTIARSLPLFEQLIKP